MKKQTYYEMTNMCMIYTKNKVLIQERTKKDWSGITFPGGHIEVGESFIESTQREIKEETGLIINDLKLCGLAQFHDNDSHHLIVLYKTNNFSGTLLPSDEGELKWIDIHHLEQLKLAGTLDYMINIFLNEEISEFIYQVKQDITIKRLL